MIAVGPRVNGFERCSAYLAKQSTGEEVALACYAAGAGRAGGSVGSSPAYVSHVVGMGSM